MTRSIILGRTGFVGANLSLYLDKLGTGSDTIDRSILKNIDATQFDNTEVIIDLVGKAHDLKNVSNADAYYEVNFELTKKIYDSFLRSSAKKFIFISSVKAVADSFEGILDENVIPNPQTDYGKSKLIAEQYIQSQFLPEGKSYYILRPCMIHGPGNKGNLTLLYKFVKKGIPYPLGAFNNMRSFLSIENLCFVINEIITRDDIPTGIYHVADDQALSTNDVVSILAASLNVKPRLWKIPKNVIVFLANVGNQLRLPLTTERLNKLTENYVVSNKKVKKALNKELPFKAIDGLKITVQSFEKK